MVSVPTLDQREARRLALARGGLLGRRWSGLPGRASGRGKRARGAAYVVIARFGYLQLDTVAVAGARSHTLVLLSRLGGLDPALPEELLHPGAPLFEYWGHEASWIPLDLYPVFGFRRRQYCEHPWWGDLLGEHPEVADRIIERVREEGPLRSVDLEGESGSGMWELKLAKKVANALWSRGDLAIRERRAFQRTYDLAERVIPDEVRGTEVPYEEALEVLLERALCGHGWAESRTLAATWRLRNCRTELRAAFHRLAEQGRILACDLVVGRGRQRRRIAGWVRPDDLELASRLRRIRPDRSRGVLLSPFDPILWDRERTQRLFDFDQVLEIFKPAAERRWGYYCMPVLAGDRLVARVDLKAHRTEGRLEQRALHYEEDPPSVEAREAVSSALDRYSGAVGLALSTE